MRKLLFTSFFIVFSTSLSAQSKVNWISFEKAVELNKTTKKPFLIDIYTDWCGWCKKMDKETYVHPVIVEFINTNYHPVKLDGEGKDPITYKDYTFKFAQQGNTKYHEFSAVLLNGKLSYPSTVILDENEQLLDRIPGYLQPKQMEMILAYFIKENRGKKKWVDFSKEFKSNIK